MKTLRILSAALTLGAIAACPTLAQDNMAKPSDGSMMKSDMKMGGMDMSGMSAADMYKAHWIAYHLDEREIKRYTAMGLNEETIKAVANIAMRTGLEMGYIIRRMQVSGVPLKKLGVMFGVPMNVISEDIPGYGGMGMMGDSMSGGMK